MDFVLLLNTGSRPNLYISEWTCSLPFVTAPAFMAGPIFQGPKPLLKSSLVATIKAYTGTNYTDEDINFALYSHYISGWGMGNATHQVNISRQLHIIDKIA